MDKIVQPYLLQRAKAQEFKPDLKTGDYLKFDYMGSAEFEFGAIPRFQRNINDKLSKLRPFKVPIADGTELWILCEVDQAYDYSKMIEDLYAGKLRTKESTGFNRKEVLYVGKKRTALYDQPHAPFSNDVWFDLDNELIIARNEQTLLNLKQTIANSVRYMDEQQKARR